MSDDYYQKKFKEASEQLAKMGYKVKRVTMAHLPLSRQLCGELFYTLTINGDKVANHKDKHGQYTQVEIIHFASKLPAVEQASFFDLK